MANISDDFNRADDTTGLGSNWQVSGSNPIYQISSNQVIFRSGGGLYGIVNNTATFSASSPVFAQVKLVTLASSDWTPGPAIRFPSDANASGYYVAVSSLGALRVFNQGAVHHTSANGLVSAGDTVRIEDQGQGDIHVFVNGTEYVAGVLDDTGSPSTGTYIGMCRYSASGTGWVLDDWTGGDVLGSSAPTITDAGRAYTGMGTIGQGNGFGYKRF